MKNKKKRRLLFQSCPQTRQQLYCQGDRRSPFWGRTLWQEAANGRVKVYVEKPDEKYCFNHVTCYLPDYTIEEIFGFSDSEKEKYLEVIRSTAHLIIEFAQEGGFDNALGL